MAGGIYLLSYDPDWDITRSQGLLCKVVFGVSVIFREESVLFFFIVVLSRILVGNIEKSLDIHGMSTDY